ncbi:DUF4735 domain-containing protein [Dysgonomonas sp. OttesenSCG-928-M03]|nr:DUF4735 domain-containing protein [Dysgonomonas sp. OttesenSCG-928-M03]
MKKVTDLFKQYWMHITGAATGALGGYLYWHYVGCLSGTCSLKSTPTVSVILGLTIGLYIFASIKEYIDKK